MENRNASKEVGDLGPRSDDDHRRSIIHIDIDCYYAQVEMVRNPELRSRPLGVQQKNIIVTANHLARSFGVEKCMPVAEGLRLCPGLVLVRGEDLQPYRQMSKDIFASLQSFGCPVERLGMDENFLDVTSLVSERLAGGADPRACGHTYGDNDDDDEQNDEQDDDCNCGCRTRLAAASHLAQEIRDCLRARLQLTSCAGVAHNKLLAKLAGALHRPDRQTIMPAGRAARFMTSLGSPRAIPGIGAKTAEALASLGLDTVLRLQACRPGLLERTFSSDIAAKLRNLSIGIDHTEVKLSGKPLSLGLEDACRSLSVESEVRERFAVLLSRLLALAAGDGRLPAGLKVTLRQATEGRSATHRETRHCSVSPSLFRLEHGELVPTEGATDKLMAVTMRLFHKLVDLSRPFRLTLIGLAFTKFRERATGRSSVADYLLKDVCVQSVMSLQSDAQSATAGMECAWETPVPEGTPEPRVKRPRPDLQLEAVARLRLGPPDVPPGVDPKVLAELPAEMQEELRAAWRREAPAEPCRPPQPTITRYFIPNKQ